MRGRFDVISATSGGRLRCGGSPRFSVYLVGDSRLCPRGSLSLATVVGRRVPIRASANQVSSPATILTRGGLPDVSSDYSFLATMAHGGAIVYPSEDRATARSSPGYAAGLQIRDEIDVAVLVGEHPLAAPEVLHVAVEPSTDWNLDGLVLVGFQGVAQRVLRRQSRHVSEGRRVAGGGSRCRR